jgi:hypothetical protein
VPPTENRNERLSLTARAQASIPSATISRLVTYLRILTALEEQGVNRTSSDHLAEEAQVSAFQVRKDLATSAASAPAAWATPCSPCGGSSAASSASTAAGTP